MVNKVKGKIMYTVWSKEEMFENFEPGFYFVHTGYAKNWVVVRLLFGVNDNKMYKSASEFHYLSELNASYLYGPIPTPRIGD